MTSTPLIVSIPNNPNSLFYGGNQIEGSVKFQPQEEVSITGITATFKGKSRTSWSTGGGKNRRHHTQRENYFKTEVVLQGPCTLHAGYYEYPIRFLLPPNIPATHDGGRTGFCRYAIDVKVACTGGLFGSKYFIQHPLTILHAPLNLNAVPDARMRMEIADTKTSCCCCCKAGPVYCMIRVERRGYVPGETIIVHAEISNKGRKRIKTSTISLTLVTLFKAHSKRREIPTDLATLVHGEVAPGQSDYWSGERLLVPATPPSDLPGCSIIDLNYVCRLRADVEGAPIDLVFDVPLIIGTIGLTEDGSYTPAGPYESLANTGVPGQPGAWGTVDTGHPITTQPLY